MPGIAPVAGKRLLLAAAIASVIGLGGCSTTSSNFAVRPVQKSVGLAERDTTSNDYEKGREYFRNGKYGLALKVFEKELVRHPQSVAALNGIGAVYDKLGRYDLAVSYYYRALQLDPDSVQTLGNLGYSFLLQGRPEAARGVLELAAAIQPDNAVVARNLAVSSEQMMIMNGGRKPATVKLQTEAGLFSFVRTETSATASSASPVEAPDRGQADLSGTPEQRQTSVMQKEMSTEAQSTPSLVRRRAAVQQSEASGGRPAELSTAATVAVSMPDHGEAVQSERSPMAGDVTHGSRDASGELVARLDSQPVETPVLREARQIVASERSRSEADPAASAQDMSEMAVIYHDLPAAVSSISERTGEVVLAFDTHESTVEISNGNGYEGMAGLLSRYYANLGQQIAHITNAEHFNHVRTVIFYRVGKRDVAKALQKRLPVRASLQESPVIRTDAQLVLGKDIAFYQGAIRRLSSTRENPGQAFAALDAQIEVSNGNGRRGMARLMSRVLDHQGEKVSHVTNADSFLYPKTRIIYAPGEKGAAKALAARLPVDAEIIVARHGALRRDVDVRVIIGHDFLRYEHVMNGLLASRLKAGAGV